MEPYFGGSHRMWAEGYARFSRHDVTLVTMPARWWSWRMRGAAVTVAERVAELAAEGLRPDVVLVSSTVDVAALRGLLHPAIGRPPLVVYFHESQLIHPSNAGEAADLSYAFLNWTSAHAADVAWFNSTYHRDVFFREVPDLLRRFPDHTHVHLIDRVAAHARVLPVGVDLSWLASGAHRSGELPLVLWNHRWQHDKDPEAFAQGVRAAAATHAFRLALAGERFRTVPAVLDELATELADRIEVDEHLPVDEYRRLLARSSIVVSTARQEFFGTSIVEAVAAGARPVLPRRLSYPWLIPEEHHDEVLYDAGGFAAALRRALERPCAPEGLPEAMRAFDWSVVAPRYDMALEVL